MLFDTYSATEMNHAFQDYYTNYYRVHCDLNVSFFENPKNYASITSAIATAVFPIHVLAFFCIIFKTPRVMDGVKKELLVLHCWTFYCDNALNVLLIGYLFAPMFCGAPLGVLHYLGLPAVVIGYLGQIGVSGVTTQLIILFETRYDAVSPNNILARRPRVKHLFIGINYVYTAVFLLPSFYTWTPAEQQIKEKMNVLKVIPCPAPVFFEDPVVVGFPPDKTWIAFYSCSIYAAVVIIQIGFFVARTVHITFFTLNFTVSLKTRSMQSRLFRCLCIQVAIPTIVICIPAIYICVSIPTSHYDQTLNNVLVLMFSSHGTFSSLCTILIYHPYRQVLKSIVMCGMKKNQASTITIPKKSHVLI